MESSHAKGMRGQSCIFAQAQFIRQRAQFLPQGGGGGSSDIALSISSMRGNINSPQVGVELEGAAERLNAGLL